MIFMDENVDEKKMGTFVWTLATYTSFTNI
jgi:hypothetical protein